MFRYVYTIHIYKIYIGTVTHEEVFEMTRKSKEIRDANNVKTWKTFAPFFVTAPVFTSFFFGLQGLENCDPTFLTEGTAWFQNLAQKDP